MNPFEVFFWICFFLICAHYFLFGIFVLLIGKVFEIPHKTGKELPKVSFIVAAYNEDKILAEKIKNDLETNYPLTQMEYIVVCDGSTDSTPEVVTRFSGQGVRCLFENVRMGKTAALNRAVDAATNDILVFSDANSMFRKDALDQLVKHFSDPRIGGVCGRKSVKPNKTRKASFGDRLYWEYESRLKQAESKLGSIPTADGEIFAMRRELYETIPSDLINDDQILTFNIINKDKRVIYEELAVTEEQASMSLRDDFNVKARMVYGGLQTLALYGDLLNPLKSWFGFQFFFHKVLRYFMWLLLSSILLSNLFIVVEHWFYAVFFGLQLLFYFLALIGWYRDTRNLTMGFTYLPYYYCNVNLAAFKGFLFFVKKSNTVDIWKKARR